MKQRKLIGILMVLLLIAGCSSEKEEVEDAITIQRDTDNKGGTEVVAAGLEAPWSIQKAGEAFYISERAGSVAVYKDGKTERQETELKEELSDLAEAGLLGFLLDSDFEKNRKAFAYYTYEQDGKPVNRIVTLRQEGSIWKETETLLDGIPGGDFHHGGRIAIGPDDKLYAATGDARKPETAQDLKSLGGKILRMNQDGTIPEDNPFGESYVFSYGHRNPQGLAWDQEGRMYSTEHGESARDELNEIKPGENYGWPVIEGDEQKEGMQSPLIHSKDDTWAPSGLSWHDGNLYFAALRGEALKKYELKEEKLEDADSGKGRIRDILIDGDSLYFISNNTDGRGDPKTEDDKLYKIPLPENE